MGFNPGEVYAAFERVQQGYESQIEDLAASRLLVGGGDDYVAIALNGYEWYRLVQCVREGVSDEAHVEAITRTTLETMAEIGGKEWYCQYAVVVALPENRVRVAVETQRDEFGTGHTGQWERV
ncbi:hypothetical protein [Natronococcus roseus]|uniref:hypothetical protein n=1 Tax=Natronococcus roseus TaxID=1052014 RepID=UPI00374DBE54